ncbi:MAG: xanthine dehydrogenase family protein [Candidatus Cloacimonetes bacterium]|nr:xanthine dehydrogenase family protein [Candidatus Cloacimonadota bacterium]
MNYARKVDARAKLDGSCKFLDDYSYPGMIHGYICYARFHHGIIRKIIFPSDFNLSEFVIVDYKDVPGSNIVPEPEKDQPFLAEKEILHWGQIILGIAHPDRELLKKFISKIQVEYSNLPALIDMHECLDDEQNIFGKEITIDHRLGLTIDPSWIRTRGIYYTPHQEQAYMETQGMIAIYDPDASSMFIRGTMQCPYFVKAAVEAIMGKTVAETVVETSEGIGGAFGGKEDFPNIIAGIAALLSYKSKKPVKIVLDRSDDIIITTKRHPSRVEIETFTNPAQKTIEKMTIDYRLDAGAYQTLSPVVLARGVLHSFGAYQVKDVFVRGRLLRSNTPPNGAFRGFGAPQAVFAIESHIDKIAAQLDLDPYDFKKINLLHSGSQMPTTQKIIDDHISDCLERVIANSDYQRKKDEFAIYNQQNRDKKGIGLAVCFHGGGYTGNGEKVLRSKVRLRIEKDARIRIFVVNTDMGQGAYTTLAQMVAESLDHPLELTSMELPNTSRAPDSGPTVASRTIYIVGNLLRELALDIKKSLAGSSLSTYVKTNPEMFPRDYFREFSPDPSVTFDEESFRGTGYRDYSWAAAVCEIKFHASTYHIEIRKFWNVLDIGRPVNIGIACGQVQGGNVQAFGYALTEFFQKKKFGRMHGFTDYTVPLSYDIPEIFLEFIHTDSPLAKGLGEIPMDYPAAAVRNAFHNATGIFIDEIPLTPERIFNQLRNQK